jgi:hypothetical protein
MNVLTLSYPAMEDQADVKTFVCISYVCYELNFVVIIILIVLEGSIQGVAYS